MNATIDVPTFCIRTSRLIALNAYNERNRLNKTVSQLSHEIGLDEGTIRKIESGDEYNYSFRSLLVLAWGLGVELHELLGANRNAPRFSDTEHEVIFSLRRVLGQSIL